ncbi:MAG: hypothetical protein KC457_23100 [Myxococcales bacterium]|nr:hypothetical protein [Myxococcales bacterium]
MHIKGTFYAGRRQSITERFGEAAWQRFEAELKQQVPGFARLITPASQVSAADYIAFQELMVRTFYSGNMQVLWTMGYDSAGWALTEGPYARLLSGAQRGLSTIESLMKRLWGVYCDEGRFSAFASEGGFELEVDQMKTWHLSIELTSMGYGHKVIELVTEKTAKPKRIHGAAEGRLGCRYRFTLS